METEPRFLTQPPEPEIEITLDGDEPKVYTERELTERSNHMAAGIRRRYQRQIDALQVAIDDLQVELAKRPPPLDADAMSLDDLEREMSAQEYEQFVSPRIRKTLRDWLAADRRITPGAK